MTAIVADREFGVRVLMVCLGNICRSPTAEAVLRRIAATEAPQLALQVDSAGTAGYHVGEPPDARAQRAGAGRGYDLAPLRARQITREDFSRFDLLLAMDRQNLANMRRIAPAAHRERARLLLEYHPEPPVLEVPDPYYGGSEGFETVLDLIEAASRGLLHALQERAAPARS
ncbi:MAG: low molecular weight protein-tyrosine-phosphatase [Steroidobacteraceae bacterium]